MKEYQAVAGVKHGYLKEWYPEGEKYLESNYKNNYLDGLFKSWYENGQIRIKGKYQEGSPQGIHLSWHENGQLMSKANYVNGKPHGICSSYDENGGEEKRYYWNGIRKKFEIAQIDFMIDFLKDNGYNLI